MYVIFDCDRFVCLNVFSMLIRVWRGVGSVEGILNHSTVVLE